MFLIYEFLILGIDYLVLRTTSVLVDIVLEVGREILWILLNSVFYLNSEKPFQYEQVNLQLNSFRIEQIFLRDFIYTKKKTI